MGALKQVPESGGVHQLGDFTTVDRRLFLISALGVVVGAVSAVVALALLLLIGFFTNLFYYGRLSTAFVSPSANSLGLLMLSSHHLTIRASCIEEESMLLLAQRVHPFVQIVASCLSFHSSPVPNRRVG
ncbi:MAG TPA: hypothetical protein VNA15_09140 [Candidatus Angelobacter sp.]|nr:hypothetical protein [Candidatus Angelobacter sp.]